MKANDTQGIAFDYTCNPYPANIFCSEKVICFLHSCIYKYALHTAYIMGANSMKADQTAPRGAV